MDEVPEADRPAMEVLQEAYGKDTFFAWNDMSSKRITTSDRESILKANHEEKWHAGIYGELKPQGVITLLRSLGVKSGMHYYDLGSGGGKTVAIAGQVFGMNATGIELSEVRHDVACAALRKLKNNKSRARSGGIRFVHGSFFDHDFSDADIVFTDSLMFSPDMLTRLGRLGRGLKQGARIVTFKVWPGADYKVLRQMEVPASWDAASRVYILEKVTAQRPPVDLPRAWAANEQCKLKH